MYAIEGRSLSELETDSAWRKLDEGRGEDKFRFNWKHFLDLETNERLRFYSNFGSVRAHSLLSRDDDEDGRYASDMH